MKAVVTALVFFAQVFFAPAVSVAETVGVNDLALSGEAKYLWTNGVIPYVIEAIPNPERVVQAIEHWNSKDVPVHLVPRTDQKNWVRFIKSSEVFCYSQIGMLGGAQTIKVAKSCEVGSIVHEIGHTAGLWHEQSRIDRDRYVRILSANVLKGTMRDFEKHQSVGTDPGAYYFDSVMHYGNFASTNDPKDIAKCTIQTIPPGIPIGQRQGLSDGDVETLQQMYGMVVKLTTISTHVRGGLVIVDGVSCRAPCKYDWQAGTTHKLSVPSPQVIDGREFEFGRWSDDGDLEHTIVVCPAFHLYQASFKVTLSTKNQSRKVLRVGR